MSRLKNWGLTLVTFFLLYIVLELFALTLFFAWLPPIANPLLDDGLPVILQHSKQALIPRHYIALTGDSYAMGLGDDFYHQTHNAPAHYGSASLIHQQTGKDVISFGSGGNGSIAGMVTEPLSTLRHWKASGRISTEDPELLLVYFYEGNDLNDNVDYLRYMGKKRKPFDYTQLNNSNYFQNYIQEVALNHDSLYQRAQQLHWYNQLYLARFVWHASITILAQIPASLQTEQTSSSDNPRSPLNPPGRFEWTEPGSLNQARINDQLIPLPDKLQGPSMDLTDEEKNIALISFHESLRFLKQHLPKTKIAVVYIPSVISSYDIASTQVSLQSHARRNQFIFDTIKVKQQSDWIAQQIQEISREENTPFIDARPFVREAGKTQSLHGPLDWNHFNHAGYQALTQVITRALAPP